MLLGIKKVTFGRKRRLGYSLFFAMNSLGHFTGGPLVDYIRFYYPESSINIDGEEFYYSSNRMIFLIGSGISFAGFVLMTFFYRETDIER